MIRSVPDAARDRPGSTQRVPKRVPVKKGGFFGMPRGVRKRAEAINFDADSPPGAKRSSFFLRSWVAQARPSDFSTIFLKFRFFRKMENRPEVIRLPAKTEVRPFALRVESLARCNLEKPLKSLPTSTQNRRKSCLGATRATFSVDFGRSKQLGRATRSDSGRLGATRRATRSDQVDRSGSIGVGRSARSRGVPRILWR